MPHETVYQKAKLIIVKNIPSAEKLESKRAGATKNLKTDSGSVNIGETHPIPDLQLIGDKNRPMANPIGKAKKCKHYLPACWPVKFLPIAFHFQSILLYKFTTAVAPDPPTFCVNPISAFATCRPSARPCSCQ